MMKIVFRPFSSWYPSANVEGKVTSDTSVALVVATFGRLYTYSAIEPDAAVVPMMIDHPVKNHHLSLLSLELVVGCYLGMMFDWDQL